MQEKKLCRTGSRNFDFELGLLLYMRWISVVLLRSSKQFVADRIRSDSYDLPLPPESLHNSDNQNMNVCHRNEKCISSPLPLHSEARIRT